MNTKTFSIRTKPEIIEKIDAISKNRERSRNYVINEALESFLSDYEILKQKVEEGLEDIKAGRIYDNDTVIAEIDELIKTLKENKK